MPKYKHTYKLFRVRSDNSIGSLFINSKARLKKGVWMPAEGYHKKGFKYRPGWHSMEQPNAPHLILTGRQWFLVEIKDYTVETRPASQGGHWYLSRQLRIVRPLTAFEQMAAINFK